MTNALRCLAVRRRRVWAAGAVAVTLAIAALWAPPAWATPVEVVRAAFEHLGGGQWQVSVTLRHADDGWEHYADLWVVETTAGRELGRRKLLHPHVNEQPFTRSQRIDVPPDVTRVQVRAGDNVNGVDSNTLAVDLTRAAGPGYEVRR